MCKIFLQFYYPLALSMKIVLKIRRLYGVVDMARILQYISTISTTKRVRTKKYSKFYRYSIKYKYKTKG